MWGGLKKSMGGTYNGTNGFPPESKISVSCFYKYSEVELFFNSISPHFFSLLAFFFSEFVAFRQ